MSRRPDTGARTRSTVLGWLAGASIVMFLLATAASAAISPIRPDKGTVEPKGSVSASFTVVDSVTSCFTADVPPRFSVAFDGLGLGLLPVNCALEGAEITMTVTAGAKAQPGDYRVTITETALGGRLLGTHEWPFTVPAPPAPTTTTIPATTTTTIPTTTTTESTTTIAAGATTSSTPARTTRSSSPTTTDPGSPTNTSGPSSAAGPTATGDPTTPAARVTPGKATSTTSPGTTAGQGGTTTDGDGDLGPGTPARDDDDTEVLAAGSSEDNLPYDRYPGSLSDNAPEILSRTVLSDQLRSQISRAFPVTVADAVLSPVVITEYLIRSLLGSAQGLLIPILIATLLGLWMVWRMREEVDDDELALSRQSMV